MFSMLESLMTSPVAWAVLACISVLSLIYAIACNRANKERREISYSLVSRVLIRKGRKKFDKLSVAYNGQQITDLCVSTLTIWNSGNKTLNASDMVASKEVTISALDGNMIYDSEILKCSEETNKFSREVIDGSTVKIFFDYIDKMEGAVVQIIHSGAKDALAIDCKIKGGMPIKDYIEERFPVIVGKYISEKLVKKLLMVSFGVLAIALLVYAIVLTVAILNDDLHSKIFVAKEATELSPIRTINSVIGNVVAVVLLWGYSVFLLAMYVPAMSIKFKIGLPRALKKYAGW